MRGTFGEQKNTDVYNSLRRGRAILSSEDQLNQYLYSYGPMIESQWAFAAQALGSDSITQNTRSIDYGCGQGLAGLMIREQLGPTAFANIAVSVLVEPSLPALLRAAAVYEKVAPNSVVFSVNKSFDDVDWKDLNVGKYANTVHVFSNVLDIGGYDHVRLIGQGLSVGRHTIIAVSHDRDHDGGSAAFSKLKTAVEHSKIKIIQNKIQKFSCKNRDESAVLWHCLMDVEK